MTEPRPAAAPAGAIGPRWIGVVRSVPVRVLVTALLLGIIALVIDWDEVRDRLSRGEWQWFAAAVALLVGTFLLGAARWHLLLRSAAVPTNPARTTLLYFFGSFANNFLPTSFGGDAARAVAAGRDGAMARSATTVTVDRLTAMACLIPIALGAIAVDPGAVPAELEVLLLASAAGCAAVGAITILSLRSRRLARLVPARVRATAREVRDTLLGYLRDARLIAAVTALGIAYQALAVLSVVWLARAIQLDLAFALVAVVVPLVLLMTLFPVSVAGFGVREGGFVVMLGTAGVDAGAATVLSLLSVAALALASLPGALALVLPSRPGGRMR